MSEGIEGGQADEPVSVRRAIAVTLALVMLPLALGALALLAAQWRNERAQVDHELRRQAAGLAHAVDLYLGHGIAQLEAIAALPAIDGGDAAVVYRYARDVVADRPGTAVDLIAPTGQMLLSTAVPLGVDLPNLWAVPQQRQPVAWQGQSLSLGAQGVTREVFRTGERAWSGVHIGVMAPRPTFGVAIPVKRGGAVVYALSLSLPAESLRSVIQGFGLGDSSLALVLDATGAVVVSSDPARFPAGARPPAPLPVGGGLQESATEWAVPGAGAMLAAHHASPHGLSVLVAKPRREALAAGVDVAIAWTALVIGTLALSVLAAARLNRSLATPLRRLAAQAQRGDLSQAPSSGIAEIEALKTALLQAAQIEAQRRDEHMRRVAAEERQEVVRANERQMRRLLDSLYVFVGVLDEKGIVVEANQTPIQRAGLRRSEVIGLPFWECPWWSHDAGLQRKLRGWVAQALAGQVVRQDVLVSLEPGHLVTVDFQLAALGGRNGGQRQLVASGVDVQQRVDALSALQAREAEARDAARRLDEQRWLLDAALEAMPAGIVVVDATGRVLRMNGANLRLWGGAGPAHDDDAPPPWRGCWAHGHPKAGEPVPADQWPMTRALVNARRETAVIEIEAFEPAGVRKTVLISASPVMDEQDNVVGGVMVQTDISDRVRAEAALREADRNKDEFLATLGHELRNPLAPIRTAVEILKQRQPADAVLVRAQQVIERQTQHMTRLVDDLLDVSRITRGLIRIRREPVTLQQAIAVAVEAALPGILAAGQRLEQDMPREAVVVLGDATRLSQMALNLLTNACKFTGIGGVINLRLRRGEGQAQVEVQDNGMGLAPESLERIFGLFAQEHPSGAGGSTGLGIGLALARQLARMHGGDVVAASPGLGQGSTFTLRLPVASEAVEPPPMPVAALAMAAPAPAPAPPPVPAGEAVVLVVDDNHDGCDAMGQLLALRGFATHVAYSGEAAVAQATQLRPDAIVLDIGLPDLDGYAVCRRLRERFGSDLVLIALTGWGQQQDKQAALAAGFDAHLTKPTDPAALSALLNRLLAARGLNGAASEPDADRIHG